MRSTLLAIVTVLAGVVPALGQTGRPELGGLTLEELLDVPVTTVARLPQARRDAPASVFVLTGDDIRRSGATSLPEALRLVPGVHVARIDGNKWAVGIRGFADRLSRSMLVLIDGRPVYSPLFAGTYWEVLDLPLGDIDRIEVVRGPGGALWGANAMTGIINIIRLSAAASAGLAASIATGTQDPAVVDLRYGGARGAGFQYRLSGRFALRDPLKQSAHPAYDDGRLVQVGGRGDWQMDRGAMTLQGDLYRTVIGQRDSITSYVPPSREFRISNDALSGGNLLFRWEGASVDRRAPVLQVYVDRSTRSELTFSERQNTADVDYQQGYHRGRHGLLWGGGYRVVSGKTNTRGTLRFTPAERLDHLVTAFIEDEILLVPERLRLAAGTKIERNSHSGFEWQPSARLFWTIDPANAMSFSVARAVRTPSRVERDFESGNLLSPAEPTFIRLVPNTGFVSEKLTAYEAGVVSLLHPNLLVTTTLFRNQHDDVLSLELGDRFLEDGDGASRFVVPVQFANGLRGHSYGIEATADVRPVPWWRSTAAYSALRIHLSRVPGGTDLTQENRAESGSPRHQVQVTSAVELPWGVSVDWFLRVVSALPDLDVDGYATSNLRIEWELDDALSMFVAGRNLHEARHAEFNDGANGVFEVPRSLMVGMRWSVRGVR